MFKARQPVCFAEIIGEIREFACFGGQLPFVCRQQYYIFKVQSAGFVDAHHLQTLQRHARKWDFHIAEYVSDEIEKHLSASFDTCFGNGIFQLYQRFVYEKYIFPTQQPFVLTHIRQTGNHFKNLCQIIHCLAIACCWRKNLLQKLVSLEQRNIDIYSVIVHDIVDCLPDLFLVCFENISMFEYCQRVATVEAAIFLSVRVLHSHQQFRQSENRHLQQRIAKRDIDFGAFGRQ